MYFELSAPTPAEPAAPAESAAPVETEAPAETPTPSAEPEPEPSAEPVATLPDAGLVRDTKASPSPSETLFELAKGYVDKPLAELQAEIGEPVSSNYVSSCLELHYDGFTVYTVKSGDSETVQDVIAD